MRYTICGYNQQVALNMHKKAIQGGKERDLSLDATDLLILRWFADFYPNMSKRTINSKEYAWVSYAAILEDFPLLNIKKAAIAERLKKMALLGILEHATVREQGTFAFFTFGEMYMNLIAIQREEGVRSNVEGVRSNVEGVCVQTDKGIRSNVEQNNPSIKYPSTKNNPSFYYPPNGDSPQNSDNGYSFKGEKEEQEQPKPKQKRFKKPTVEEIAEYCKSRNNNIDAQHFYDHYESVGWIVGRSPMKDWQATVRTWEKNNKQWGANKQQPNSREDLSKYYDMTKDQDLLPF